MTAGAKCEICKTHLLHLATDRGHWLWCRGCGSIYKALGDAEPKLIESPGVLAALRAIQSANKGTEQL
jgi:hypothetical protein